MMDTDLMTTRYASKMSRRVSLDLIPGKGCVLSLKLCSPHKEWDRIRNKGVWDESVVHARPDIGSIARHQNRDIHVGRVFGMH